METNEQIVNRINKINDYNEHDIESYPNQYKAKNNIKEVVEKYDGLSKEELAEQNNVVNLFGRVMTKRGQGKAGFLTIKDVLSTVQLYLAKDNLDENDFFVFKNIDVGDIVYAKGEVFRTKTDALAIRVYEFKLVTKSIRPLPEKFHGLTDIETIYRQRYLDLIVNDKSKEVFIKRSKVIAGIRNYLNSKGYLEVETPILQNQPGGAAAKPFITKHNTLDMDMYLRIAPELYLKRIIVGGINKVYEIGRLFRNEGMSIKHNPEFTSVELYEAYGDMDSMMEITEDLLKTLAMDILGTTKVEYMDHNVDLSNFRKIHMVELVKEVTGIDFFKEMTFDEAKKYAKQENVELEKHHVTVGHVINEFFEQKCEDKIIEPTFVYGHPKEVSPLARLNNEDKRFTDRFELFIIGREYANAFSELNDPFDQKQRFEAQLKESDLGNEEATGIDDDFIEALSYGMPPTGGLGIGIDRLVMLLTNSDSIKDVILFPTLKDENK